MLLPPRAGPTCAHRCSVLARSRPTHIVLLSLRGWDPEGGRVYLVTFQEPFPLKAVRCVPGPRFHCFTLLNGLHSLSSDHLPRNLFLYKPTLQTR